MGRKPNEPWLTVELNWQRLLTIVFLTLGLAIISYRLLVRPAISAYVGHQVSQQISQEIAAELAQAVVVGLDGGLASITEPSQGQPGAVAPGSSVQSSVPVLVGGGQPAPNQAAPTQIPGQLVVISAAQDAEAPQPEAQASAVAQAVISQMQGTSQPNNQAAGPEHLLAGPPTPGATIGVPGASPPAPPAASPAPVVGTPIAAPQSERSIKEIVAALPPGELVVTEQKLNEKIAPRVANMAPIERVEVRFVPGSVQVTLTVFGRVNLATAGLTVSGNRVVGQNPRIEGPLGVLVSPADLVRPIEQELNDTLELADRQVHTVRIEQGRIVVALS